jgi:hypothetical protein
MKMGYYVPIILVDHHILLTPHVRMYIRVKDIGDVSMNFKDFPFFLTILLYQVGQVVIDAM